MSIICVRNVPATWTMKDLAFKLQKSIKGPFETLNFSKGHWNYKNAYLRLSETLDPSLVIQTINAAKKKGKLIAIIPKKIPDLPLSKSHTKNVIPATAHPQPPDQLPLSHVKKVMAATAPPQPADETLIAAHQEIISALQSKYTGLFKLSLKRNHKLMNEIAKTVLERLRHIMETNIEYAKTPFILTKSYRKSYPHFTDFQLVLSTMHACEDAAGAPRTQLQENELFIPTDTPAIANISYEKVQKTCHKYADKIEKKVVEHVNSLIIEPLSETPTPEELARHRVRTELKKVAPYMGNMLRQVVASNFVNSKPSDNKLIRMKLYGEPYLPTRDFLDVPVMQRFMAKKIVRSDRIFNMVAFHIPRRYYSALMELDNTEMGGAKLIICKSEVKHYKPPKELYQKMLGKINNADQDIPEPDMNEEDMEDWGEDLLTDEI